MATDDGEPGAQHQVEVILLKQVASYLATPIFVVDGNGTLVYFNEPAEVLLGRRYDESGEMPASEWSTIFFPMDEDGSTIPPEELPLSIAITERKPAHGSMHIVGLDQIAHRISVTAFPLVGQHDRNLGAIAIFWEDER
jgi:hypothetical protein